MNTFINSLKVNSIDEAFIDIFKKICNEDTAFDDLILRTMVMKVNFHHFFIVKNLSYFLELEIFVYNFNMIHANS